MKYLIGHAVFVCLGYCICLRFTFFVRDFEQLSIENLGERTVLIAGLIFLISTLAQSLCFLFALVSTVDGSSLVHCVVDGHIYVVVDVAPRHRTLRKDVLLRIHLAVKCVTLVCSV